MTKKDSPKAGRKSAKVRVLRPAEVEAVVGLPQNEIDALSDDILHAGDAELSEFEAIAKEHFMAVEGRIAELELEIAPLRREMLNLVCDPTHAREIELAKLLAPLREELKRLKAIQDDPAARAKMLIKELRDKALLRQQQNGKFRHAPGFPLCVVA